MIKREVYLLSGYEENKKKRKQQQNKKNHDIF